MEIVDVLWSEAPQVKVCDECESDIPCGSRYGIYYERLAVSFVDRKQTMVIRSYCEECTELVIDSLTTDSYRPQIQVEIEATILSVHANIQ